MNKRGLLLRGVLLPVLVGAGGLIQLMSQPRFASIRTVDVVKLMGSGACFTVAIISLGAAIRGGAKE